MQRMKKELRVNILHLEDEEADQKAFKSVYNSQLKRRLVKFFKDNFQARCVPSLHQSKSVDEFSATILTSNAGVWFPTTLGRDAVLFVLDFYVRKGKETKPEPIDGIELYDEVTQTSIRFLDWLRHHFPYMPVVFLTSGGSSAVPQGWEYIPKDTLHNPDGFGTKISQYAKNWWEPTFANELDRYAVETGDSSWHTPGHNAGNAFLESLVQRNFYKSYAPMIFRTDLSVSVSRLGDLSEPERESPLERSRQRSAEIFGSDDTFYVTNGTSTSNKAILQALMRSGDVVLIDRNCHKSVHQAVVMAGVLPFYMPPAFNHALGVWSPLSMDLLARYLEADSERPDALRPKMMVITSSTYEGVLYPIGRLARLCEQHEVLLVADEAWAPHLRFHPFYGGRDGRYDRYNATDAGAHVCVQSTHKALAAFSQASMIHISQRLQELLESSTGWQWLKDRFGFEGRGSYERFKHQLFEVLRYWHSTSPHYPMLATLDRAGIQMRLEGARLIDERLKWATEFERSVASTVRLGDIVGPERCGKYADYLKDPLKLVIASPTSAAVRALKKALTERHIMWEKSTSGCIEFLITIGTVEGNVQSLRRFLDEPPVRALHEKPIVDAGSLDYDNTIDQVDVLPHTAVSSEGVMKSLEEMARLAEEGKRLPVCAQMVTPYPPGIPIMLPGLRINSDMIKNVMNALTGGEVHGIHSRGDGKHYIQVMTESDEQAAMADSRLVEFRQWLAKPAVAALLSRGDR